MDRRRFVAFDSILLVGSAVIPWIIQEILRDVDSIRIERHVLKLNPELLSVRLEKCEVFANRTEVILVFALLKLPPRVSDLRAFKCGILEKGLCLGKASVVSANPEVARSMGSANAEFGSRIIRS